MTSERKTQIERRLKELSKINAALLSGEDLKEYNDLVDELNADAERY